jgi:ubiquinone/menaquinone biosynthesis C-methylase UbiE
VSEDPVRETYDAVAAEYAARLGDELDYKPLDRALLAVLVEQSHGAAIGDLGCGPGHVTAWLQDHGARSVGIDLSPGMIEIARRRRPDVEYRVGDLRVLPVSDKSWRSVVVLYSLIHLDGDEMRVALAEISRVLEPQGLALISFHVGTGLSHRDEWWGHDVSIDFHFLEPAHVVTALEEAGFTLEMQLERAPYPEEVSTRRAYLLARRA